MAAHLRLHLQILVAVAVEAAHNKLLRLPVLLDKETTAEREQELTPAAEAVVLALWEAMLLPARLAVLVVPDQHGRKIVWTMPAAEAVVVNRPLVEHLAAQVVAVTAQTTLAHQQSQLPELSTLAAVAAADQVVRALLLVEAALSLSLTQDLKREAAVLTRHPAEKVSMRLRALAPLPTQAKHGTLRRNQRKQDRPARDRRS